MKKKLMVEDFEAVFGGRTPGIQDARGVFAVLVPLVMREGELHLLFEVRAETLRGQPGEICFPGGRVEYGETPKEASLRETFEEVGISSRRIRVIGPLDIIQDISNRVIYPYLAYVDETGYAQMSLNRDEVKETFLVPLSFLQEQPPYIYNSPVTMQVGEDFPYEKIGFSGGYAWRSGIMEVPVYEHSGHQIWGLTARIVKRMLDLLEQEGRG